MDDSCPNVVCSAEDMARALLAGTEALTIQPGPDNTVQVTTATTLSICSQDGWREVVRGAALQMIPISQEEAEAVYLLAKV